MLQAAFGASFLIEGNITEFIDDPTYYEPGFNLMSPLEISSPEADIIFILIRKRVGPTGVNFENMNPNNISASAIDVTNGESLGVSVASNIIYDPWNDEDPSNPHTPLVLEISNQLNVNDPVLRVRIIDCTVKDETDNSFINFRIIVDDDASDLYFNYIPVHRKTFTDRNTFTSAGKEAHVILRSDSDSYVLFSPYAWFRESTKEESDFSYPANTVYYQRQSAYNNEDFSFSLQSWSNSFVADHISVMNIPGYKKAAIVQVDNAIYSHLVEIGRSASATISVIGELSEIIDTFKINFYS